MSEQRRFRVSPAVRGMVLGGLLLGSLVPLACSAAGEPSQLAGAGAAAPYTMTVAKVSATKGHPATAKVVITPAKGYHMNAEYPMSLKLLPPADVTAAKTELKKADAKLSENEGSFEVTLTAASAGPKKVPGEVRFAVCTDTTCDPQKSQILIQLDVK